MHYDRPRSTATWGTMAKDWEAGIDFGKLQKDRLERAQAATKDHGLGSLLCFNFDNIRYITSTHIGEWGRDKFDRYCLSAPDTAPFLWDPAPPRVVAQGVQLLRDMYKSEDVPDPVW